MIDSEYFTKIQSSLSLFYDNDSILRVNTRICDFQNFANNNKLPTLLQSTCYFTKLILLNFREGGCDSGVDSTLNFIRSSFLITRADEQ